MVSFWPTFANQAATALDKARIYRISMARLEELSQAQAELARKSRQLQRALSTVVRVQEHERSRIAADVHDGVVQLMVGSLLELQAAMSHFGQASDTVIKKYSRARELIQEAVAELRRRRPIRGRNTTISSKSFGSPEATAGKSGVSASPAMTCRTILPNRSPSKSSVNAISS